jgi:hypothetical protein
MNSTDPTDEVDVMALVSITDIRIPMDPKDPKDPSETTASTNRATGVPAGEAGEQLDFVDAFEEMGGSTLVPAVPAVPAVPTWVRSKRITDALAGLYLKRAERGCCVVVPELPDCTGHATRRIDLYVTFLWDGDGQKRIAYEVKVTRADFLSELRNPEKRAFALSVSNEYYFATPLGLVRPSEIPSEAGLVEVSASGVRVKRKAPDRETGRPSWHFVAALTRAATRLAAIP